MRTGRARRERQAKLSSFDPHDASLRAADCRDCSRFPARVGEFSRRRRLLYWPLPDWERRDAANSSDRLVLHSAILPGRLARMMKHPVAYGTRPGPFASAKHALGGLLFYRVDAQNKWSCGRMRADKTLYPTREDHQFKHVRQMASVS